MKRKSLFVLLVVVLSTFLLTSCQTRTSDSGLQLKTVGNKIDSNIYVLNVTMIGEPASNQNLGGEGKQQQFSDIYGYGNMRIWQEGKGLVSVHVNSISPQLDYIQPGMDVVLKTSDLKIMAVMDGYTFEVKCRNDYEPVAALENNEITTDRYETYELDYCRMSDPEIQYTGVEGQ